MYCVSQAQRIRANSYEQKAERVSQNKPWLFLSWLQQVFTSPYQKTDTLWLCYLLQFLNLVLQGFENVGTRVYNSNFITQIFLSLSAYMNNVKYLGAEKRDVAQDIRIWFQIMAKYKTVPQLHKGENI